MLRKSVDTSPNAYNKTIPKLLTSPRPREERLPIKQQNRENNPIRNERRAHNKMRQTLPHMLPSAKPLRRNPAKQELHPRQERNHTSHHPMRSHRNLPHLSQKTALNMQLQHHPHPHLHNEHQHQPIRKPGVRILSKLPSLMRVAQKVPRNRNSHAQYLNWDVPARADEAEYHAGREYDAPGEALQEDVRPQGAVDGVGADGGALGDFVVAAVGAGEGGEEGEGEQSSFWSRAEGRHCGGMLPLELGWFCRRGWLTSRDGGCGGFGPRHVYLLVRGEA